MGTGIMLSRAFLRLACINSLQHSSLSSGVDSLLLYPSVTHTTTSVDASRIAALSCRAVREAAALDENAAVVVVDDDNDDDANNDANDDVNEEPKVDDVDDDDNDGSAGAGDSFS